MNGPDSFGADHLLLAGHDILQEVDRHVVIWREVDADVGREEIVDFSLALVLGRELLLRYLSAWVLCRAGRMHWLIDTVHLELGGLLLIINS